VGKHLPSILHGLGSTLNAKIKVTSLGNNVGELKRRNQYIQTQNPKENVCQEKHQK
jgi:hypothetical protein